MQILFFRNLTIKTIAAICLIAGIALSASGCNYSDYFNISPEDAQKAAQEAQKIAGDIMNQVNGSQDTMNEVNDEPQYSWADPLPQGIHVHQEFAALSGGVNHLGVDLDCDTGGDVEVRAIFAGTVTTSEPAGKNGELVVLRHDVGDITFYSSYSHLKKGSRLFKVGDPVYEGDILGVMGDTGYSTGPHLHLAVFSSAASSDPLGYTTYKTDPGSEYLDEGARRFYDPMLVISSEGGLIIDNYR